jgi:polyhydroxyalkanoate synthesis regulator phasin
LGILKKEPDETLDEVTNSLVNTGMFDMREAKQVLQELKEAQYIVNEQLSIKGIAVAQEAEAEFKLQ